MRNRLNGEIPVIEIRDLTVAFNSPNGPIPAIDNIDFELYKGETIAFMGETGCGKSVFGHSCMRLLDDIAQISGQILYRGRNLYEINDQELREIQGGQISLIPQSAATAFDPVMKIGRQITEFIEKTGKAKGAAAVTLAMESLTRAGFRDNPELIYESYPHRLSGGMNERALIAMAVSVNPDIVIADEPTKGLDPQAKEDILKLLKKVTENTSMILITHDFETAEICNKTAIMYSGQIIEFGPTHLVFSDPRHYYTKGLIKAHPANGLQPIAGSHIQGNRSEEGCRFRNRCTHAEEICSQKPVMKLAGDNRFVRCHYA